MMKMTKIPEIDIFVVGACPTALGTIYQARCHLAASDGVRKCPRQHLIVNMLCLAASVSALNGDARKMCPENAN